MLFNEFSNRPIIRGGKKEEKVYTRKEKSNFKDLGQLEYTGKKKELNVSIILVIL